jgi:DNA-binding transcriptional LysR family regulator
MHLESMRIFRDLVETGSFSRAAELNYLTQSAVSQQLQQLERAVGRPLLERGGRQLKLTDAGKVFFRSAKRIVSAYEEITARMHSVSPESERRLRIAAIYSVGPYVLQGYLKGFLKRHPEVKVEVEYQKASRICDDLLRGRADLGLMAYPVKRRDLQVIPLADDELVLVMPKRHPLAARESVTLADLSGQDFIAFDRGTPTRKALDKLLRKENVRPKVRMELDNIETIKNAVSTGMGVAIVPAETVAAEAKAGKLCLRRFSGARLSRPLGCLVRKVRRGDWAVKAFLKHISA